MTAETKPQAKENDMISIEQIEEMYSNMQSDGINTDADFLYGYFFLSENGERLEQAIDDLEALNFQFVNIYPSDDTTQWCLHLDKIESHNSKTLFELNKELYKIADTYNIEYDGFNLENPLSNDGVKRGTYAMPEEFQMTDFTEDGFPVLLVSNTAFDTFQHKEEFQFFIKITTAYKGDTTSILPVHKELTALDEFEYFIENNLTQNGIKNYYLFRTTHKGIRIFYLAISEDVKSELVLKTIKKHNEQRAFDFEIIEDKNWDLYTDSMKKILDQ